MRDYSFGNFISALRIGRGLSQYQLGALVHVSDKAVSKWENGVSKPRMKTIIKLAEVLDIGVDELLACKYTSFEEERKDLFAMENKIMELAERNMKALYGDHPDICITNRFQTEKMMLRGQEMLRWMGFLGYLHDQFCENNAFFYVRDAQMGASLIAWLLGGTNVNPLPAHYYCPVCKKTEFLPDTKCGLDAPDKICSCGNRYEKDGFGIDSVHMYPMSVGKEIYASGRTEELVESCLRQYFDPYGKICKIQIPEENRNRTLHVARYIFIPEEKKKHYPQDTLVVNLEEYWTKYRNFAKLTVVKDPEDDFSFHDLAKTKFTSAEIKAYAAQKVRSNSFKNALNETDLNPVMAKLPDLNFTDLLSVSGLLHGTGVWKDNGENLYKNGVPFRALISNREDVYAYLYERLNHKCCEGPVGQAYELKENTRKGNYYWNGMPEDTKQLLLKCDVPEWYIESMKKIHYLFPKASMIAYLKMDISRSVKCGLESTDAV